MTENPTALPVESAAITDRGLSQKRPLNEDSMLNDPEHRIFAVADGVGGAQAGEVASQTAIEVLSEAFRHHSSDEDIEDLMEIAIQRANDSIYRMSREQPRFAMMATTIVALHLNGLRATIGHVGDSRLYRLTPDGGCPSCGTSIPGRWADKFEGQIADRPFFPRRASRLVTILN